MRGHKPWAGSESRGWLSIVVEMSRERDEPMSEAQLEVAWMVVLLGGALVLMGGVALNVLIDHLAVSFALAGVPSVLMVAVLWRRYVH